MVAGTRWWLIVGCCWMVWDVALAAEATATSADPAGPSTFGARGLFRSVSPEPFAPGSVVIGSSLEYFKAGDFLISGDQNEHMLARFTISGVPILGLDLHAGFSLIVNRNVSFEPSQNQVIGDPFIGVGYGRSFNDWLSLGAGVQALIPSGNNLPNLAVDGIKIRFMANFEFRPIPDILVVLNLGYHVDNSEKGLGNLLFTEAQRFTAGVSPHNQLLGHVGAAWQLGWVAPFLEFGTAQALGAEGMAFEDNPSWLTLGVRAWPLGHHTFHLLAAVDIGLSGIHPPENKARIPPYNAILAIGYDFGQVPEPQTKVEVHEVIRVKQVEAPRPKPSSRIVGQVVDAQTGKPLGGARIVVGEKQQTIFLSESEQGRFSSCLADPGPIKLKVSLEGYREETTVVLLTEEPEVPVTIRLQPRRGKTYGILKGTIRAATGKALPARISIPARGVKSRASKHNGKFQLKLETGLFDVLMSMPGYVTQRRKVKLGAGDVVILNVELYPKK